MFDSHSRPGDEIRQSDPESLTIGPSSNSDDDTLQGTSNQWPLWRLLVDQARIDDAVLAHQYRGSGTTDDPYIVAWTRNDPGNPYNWSSSRRMFVVLTTAATCFAVAYDSSAYTGALMELQTYFHRDELLITCGVSLFVLGFCVGPFFWAPLSEIYGRQIIFLISYGGFTIFSAACTADNGIATLLVMRFLAGASGSSTLTNAGGVISDVYQINERNIPMVIFALAPSLAPTLGPMTGGFLSTGGGGWRWVMGLMAIVPGVLWIVGACCIPETYAPILLQKRARALSIKLGNVYKTELEIRGGLLSPGQIIKQSLYRPWVLLLTEPIVLILSIYTAIIYGTLYLLFGAFPIVFQEERGWSPGLSGLAFLGVAIGMFATVPGIIAVNIWYVKKARITKGGILPPEYRLPGAMIGSIFVPIGMFWFAWTTFESVHWVVPIAAGAPFGFGLSMVFTAIFAYLIDSYTIYAASALAGNTMLRSLFAAAFPLFTTHMYHNLGTQWASTVPAFLALACTPFPFILWKYGPAIRKRCKFSARAMEAAAAAYATEN